MCSRRGRVRHAPTERKPPEVAPTIARALPARVSASIATEHGPSRLIVGPEAVYVGNRRVGSVQRVDPATKRVASTTLVGGQLTLPYKADTVNSLWARTNADSKL